MAARPVNEAGHLIEFSRDVAPILVARCIECHGPKQVKSDFRVDDRSSLLGYISPENIEDSSLWSDFLVTDDEDLLMPPASKGGPLNTNELAILRTWIAEGADWPEGEKLSPDLAVVIPQRTTPPLSLFGRIWAFQGYFHPATVHFPVALLSVGGLFVVIGWLRKTENNDVAYYCLLLGALSAIFAATMGWSFAVERGFGNWDNLDNMTLTRHRWFGVGVSVFATAMAIIAIVDRQKQSFNLQRIWQLGLVLCAFLAGLVGHQGGELSYGERLYHDAFERLLGDEKEITKE